jgi:hypothetical protein
MPYQAAAAQLLARWREVERELETVPPASPEAEALIADAAALRNEYQRVIAEARAAEQPEPPAWSTKTA